MKKVIIHKIIKKLILLKIKILKHLNLNLLVDQKEITKIKIYIKWSMFKKNLIKSMEHNKT